MASPCWTGVPWQKNRCPDDVIVGGGQAVEVWAEGNMSHLGWKVPAPHHSRTALVAGAIQTLEGEGGTLGVKEAGLQDPAADHLVAGGPLDVAGSWAAGAMEANLEEPRGTAASSSSLPPQWRFV